MSDSAVAIAELSSGVPGVGLSIDGRSEVGDGLLLRTDICMLFGEGYLMVTPGHQARVSRCYAFQDRRLAVLSSERAETPS